MAALLVQAVGLLRLSQPRRPRGQPGWPRSSLARRSETAGIDTPGRRGGDPAEDEETNDGPNVRFALANPSHYRVMFGGFVDQEARDPELAAEAAGAFQVLVDALVALQRDALLRGEDTVTMARFVWAVVHGVSMLGIDGQLREPHAVERLTRYAIERLQTGIEAKADHRPAP